MVLWMYTPDVQELDGPRVILFLALVLLFTIGTGPLVFLALWKARRSAQAGRRHRDDGAGQIW
jgi:hypothetical protein